MDTCGIIAPRQSDIIGYREDKYLAECICPKHHLSPHVIKTPEGRYFDWEDDWECGCCEPDEDEHCYTFGEITEEEAQEYINKGRR